MSFKKRVVYPAVLARLTSESRMLSRREKAEQQRKKRGLAHVVQYFHQVDDPYSSLLLQLLSSLEQRYDVQLSVFLVPPPDAAAAPERAALVAYSRRDAALTGSHHALGFVDSGAQPGDDLVQQATAILAKLLAADDFVAHAGAVDAALWANDQSAMAALATEFGAVSNSEADATLKSGAEKREQLGHYLGATLHYAGEWYWGVDRLHYLEQRLAGLGTWRGEGAPGLLAAPPVEDSRTAPAPAGSELDYYLSLRSPYTYIAAPRIIALAQRHQITLNLRFVLPMVMRGLPVPKSKRIYIVQDVAREARRLGILFGRSSDPLGAPTERGMAILPYAIAEGCGEAYVMSFLQGVWAEGIYAGSDRGLRTIVERAGLSWSEAQPRLADDQWREQAETNRAELVSLGLWGVPSFRVGGFSIWGQDRIWMVDQAVERLRERR